jgi:hypothetical protein
MRCPDVQVGLEEEARAEPPDGVRPKGVEGHVSKVQQPREAHHDVQTKGHHHIGERDDRGVQKAAGLAEEERQDDRDDDQDRGQTTAPPRGQPLPERIAPLAQLRAELARSKRGLLADLRRSHRPRALGGVALLHVDLAADLSAG